MVHYHADLAAALERTQNVSVIAIKARAVSDEYYAGVSKNYSIETGAGAFGTLFNLLNPVVVWRLIQILRKSRADIFHVTAPHEWNPLLGILITKLLRKPLLYTIHDIDYHEGTPYYFKLPDMIFRKMAGGFFVHSDAWKKSMVSNGVAVERISAVPLGVFLNITQWEDLKIQEEKAVLFFGRIERYKGLDILLEAAPKIFSELPDWRFIIAGDGDFRPYEGMVNDERIEVLNRYIEDAEVANLFRRAKIVIFPYRAASQSGIIPIALAFGKAVVATNVGELSDALGGGKFGLLIQPEDVNSLVKAVLSLAKDEGLRKRLAENAFEARLHSAGWDTIVAKHAYFYHQIRSSLR